MAYQVGNRIRQYREAKNLTQKQLAELIGVTNSRVSNWEQGVNRPDIELLVSICRALSVSPSILLDIRLSDEELNEQERNVIMAYRARADLQQAVNILLGIDDYDN